MSTSKSSRPRVRRPSPAVFCALAAASGGLTAGTPAGEPPPAPPAREIRIPVPDVTGLAAAPDGSLLLVSRADPARLLFRLPAEALLRDVVPGEVLAVFRPGAQSDSLADPVDLAVGAGDEIFVLGSHARSRFGDAPEARYRLARTVWGPNQPPGPLMATSALLDSIVETFPFLTDSIRRTPARAGLSLDGLALLPSGELLVGVRSPTITESTPRPAGGQEDAVVLTLRQPRSLFSEPRQPAHLSAAEKLDLGGQGIRAMCPAPGSEVFILSGLSVEPNHPVQSDWKVWRWNRKDPPRPLRLRTPPALKSPGALAVLPLHGKPTLLIGEGGPAESRVAAIDLPPDPP